jgi:hypothetical protein
VRKKKGRKKGNWIFNSIIHQSKTSAEEIQMITPKVRILNRNQIDDSKWNLTIRQAVNSLPYAYTWYLDALCTKWIGLIVGEYEFVMPLAVGRKWGLLYVYQPLFCQQLGVFYRRHSDTIIELMIHTALKKFIFVNLNLNFDNAVKNPIRGLSKKKNLTLKLTDKHSDIQKSYTDNTLRNIKKAQKAGLTCELADNKSMEGFTDFYVQHTAVRDTTFKPSHIKALQRLVHQFLIHSCGRLFLARTAEGEICAGVIVIETDSRIIHLLPAADDTARQHGGMQFLVDGVLCHYAQSGKIYDFEGSSVESIARFYEGFGGVRESFFELSKSPLRATRLSK